ncbi:hypothetical protein AB0J64_55685, partial [Nonomuraea sp. NPDC049695]
MRAGHGRTVNFPSGRLCSQPRSASFDREGMALAKKNGKLKDKQPKLPEPARRYAEGEVSLADLATEYSVGRSTVHRIIHGPETA